MAASSCSLLQSLRPSRLQEQSRILPVDRHLGCIESKSAFLLIYSKKATHNNGPEMLLFAYTTVVLDVSS